MLTKEEIESWNNLFPHCKLNEDDLTNPNEQYLTRVLCAYLRMFGYKVELMDMGGADMIHEKRHFLIKVVRHIDQILKISHKSYTFTYYDLINPTRKRTSIMLSILLNYLHYYKMYQTETLSKTNERLQTEQQLQKSVNEIRGEILKNETDAKEINVRIAKLKTRITKGKAELQNLDALVNKISTDMNMLQTKLRKLDEELNARMIQKRELKEQIFTNAEAKALKSQIAAQHQSLENMRQRKENIEGQAKNIIQSMHNLQEMLKQLQVAEHIADKTQTTCKEYQEKLKELELQMKDLSASDKKRSELKEKLKQNKQDIALLTKQWEQENLHLDEQTNNIMNSIEQENEALKLSHNRKKAAEEEHQEIDFELQKEIALVEYLEERIAELNLQIQK